MRSVRAKEKSIIDGFVSVGFVPLAIVFLVGLLGALLGFVVGTFSKDTISMLIIIFLGLILSGLVVAFFLNKNLEFLANKSMQTERERQYNAFTMIIFELEDNLSANNAAEIKNRVFNTLKYETMLFPPHIYDEMVTTYNLLEELKDLEGEEFRNMLHREMEIPILLSELKDYKQKIRRYFYYV